MQFFCVGSAESLAFTGAGFTGADKLGIGEGCAIVHEALFDFKKIPQPVGETALQPAAFVATKPWRTPRFGEVKRKKRRWNMEAGSA